MAAHRLVPDRTKLPEPAPYFMKVVPTLVADTLSIKHAREDFLSLSGIPVVSLDRREHVLGQLRSRVRKPDFSKDKSQ